jgi:hypothetical protein
MYKACKESLSAVTRPQTPVLALSLLLLFASLASAAPNPQLLQPATIAQVPQTAAYNALNVPAMVAGSFYLDPTTQVKVYKVTDASFPTSGCDWVHDYAEGGDEVSLPHGSEGTRSIHVVCSTASGVALAHWLIDFVPNPISGPHVRNPRQLTGALEPRPDGGFAFSNNPTTPQYAYVANANTVRRIDIFTMTEASETEQIGATTVTIWPVEDVDPTWLHQSANDELFVWMQASSQTVVGYKPALGIVSGKKTHDVPDLNEPRIDRGGRYVGLSLNTGNCRAVWDWDTDVVQNDTCPDPNGNSFAHQASLKRRWLGFNAGVSAPYKFAEWTSDVPNSGTTLSGPLAGDLFYANGNWIQNPANLDDQWALTYNYGALLPPPGGYLAPGGIILITANAADRRLLGHMYSGQKNYAHYSFCKFSPDGYYVLFTSDMNVDGTARSDQFLAELPTDNDATPTPTVSPTATATPTPTPTAPPSGCGTMQNVIWTSLVNVTATGNFLQKTAGCDGCDDAGATSQQQIASGDGCLEVTASETTRARAFGLGNGNTNTTLGDVDWGIFLTVGGAAEVREQGLYMADTTFVTGDVFRVAAESGAVKYYKNGGLLYTSQVAPSYPLLVDTSLWSEGATIDNARMTGATPTPTPTPVPGCGTLQNVVWTDLVNVTATGNSIQKTAGCDGCDDATARSQQHIGSGEGCVEVTASETTTGRIFGLAFGNWSTWLDDVDWGIFFTVGGWAEVREKGVYKWDMPMSSGDVFRVAVDSGVIKYFRNGGLLYTSQTAATYPLHVDTSLLSSNSTLSNARITAGGPQGVVWTNLVNATAHGNNLVKTSGLDASQDSGATSVQQITAGDGYVQEAPFGYHRASAFGLSNGNSGTSIADIDFALFVTVGNDALVYEQGVYKAAGTAFDTGDVLRVAVESGVVKYSKNGVVFYTSLATPNYPLVMDTSLLTNVVSINDAVIVEN